MSDMLQPRTDPRSTEDLIRVALTLEGDERDKVVSILHWRGTLDVLEAARELCESAAPAERELGADILGQLGVPQRTFPNECFHLLAHTLDRESLSGVLESIAFAFGYLRDARSIEYLLRLKNHARSEVRFAVAWALPHEDERAITGLIELSADPDEDVRDWATFGLGTQIETDTSAIRDALAARLVDPHNDTRAEALVGLAKRRDEQALHPLMAELARRQFGWLAVEAAAELADPRLYPLLVRIRDEITDLAEYEKQDLIEAIRRCKA